MEEESAWMFAVNWLCSVLCLLEFDEEGTITGAKVQNKFVPLIIYVELNVLLTVHHSISV
jgi:hypothetical protein